MIILGIDPGTATTGFGIVEKQKDNFILVANVIKDEEIFTTGKKKCNKN